MSEDQDRALSVLAEFLKGVGKGVDVLSSDLGLWGEGLGLDSLEAAELSALLEDELGSDPFSAGGEMPERVADILAFYGPAL